MISLLFLSDHFKPTGRKIKFAAIVIARFFRILFRFKRSIEIIGFDYSDKHLFTEGFLVLRYEFKNALWYNFKGIKKTTAAGSLVLNPENIHAAQIPLIVHGFFRKKRFVIEFAPDQHLETQSFITKIHANLFKDSFMPSIRSRMVKPSLISIKPVVSMSQPQTIQRSIKLNFTPFKQNDLL